MPKPWILIYACATYLYGCGRERSHTGPPPHARSEDHVGARWRPKDHWCDLDKNLPCSLDVFCSLTAWCSYLNIEIDLMHVGLSYLNFCLQYYPCNFFVACKFCSVIPVMLKLGTIGSYLSDIGWLSWVRVRLLAAVNIISVFFELIMMCSCSRITRTKHWEVALVFATMCLGKVLLPLCYFLLLYT